MKTLEDLKKKYFKKVDFLDLDLIVAEIIKKTREFVLSHPEYTPSGAQIAKIESFIHRRAKHEPLAYILGHKEFYGLTFKVTPDTLIPRPETELLVEETLKILQTTNHELQTIIDIGTGSGNIIISIAKNYKLKTTNYIAIDVSKKALGVAKQNAKLNKVSKKIKFVHGNLLDKIENTNNSIIIANLPYLDKDWKNLLKSSDSAGLKFEPATALYGGKDGLDFYRELAEQIKSKKIQNSILLCEIGHLQAPGMKKTFSFARKVEFQKDLAKKWRICKIEI